jgi:6-phosphogluconolactonase (cycloisomerase 2 family)
MDITKDGKYVYVAARALQGVIAFSRNKTSGILSPAGCVSEGGAADGCTALPGVGLKGATDVAVSPDAAHVYVTADGSHAVTSFKRNKSNGSLTQLTGADGCWSETGQDGGVGSLVCRDGRGLSGANGIAATADGKFIYVTSSGSSAIAIFSRDKKTGTLSQATGIAGCVSQNGEDGNVAGACTPADIGGLNQAQKVTVSQDGLTLYATASKSNAVSSFSRNTTTGALTQLNCVSSTDLACDTGVAFGGAQGIAITKDGKNVYSTAPKDDAVDTLARN